MTLVVVDASITIAWFIPDESSPTTRRVFDHVVEHGAIVPTFWPIEIANAFSVAVRRGRITVRDRAQALAHLADMQLASDDQTVAQVWTRTLELADRYRLTVYDACYLELAMRTGLALASLDHDLRKAGRAVGLELLGVEAA